MTHKIQKPESITFELLGAECNLCIVGYLAQGKSLAVISSVSTNDSVQHHLGIIRCIAAIENQNGWVEGWVSSDKFIKDTVITQNVRYINTKENPEIVEVINAPIFWMGEVGSELTTKQADKKKITQIFLYGMQQVIANQK